jgi:hypothetical protein
MRTLAILCVLISGGCAAARDERPAAPLAAPPDVQPSASASPLALFPATRGGMQALLRGRLELVDGCLYVVDGRGDRRVPIFRSPGSEWDAARGVSFEGRWLRPGEEVELPGGETRVARSSDRWVKPPPASCDLSSAWLVTQSPRLQR